MPRASPRDRWRVQRGRGAPSRRVSPLPYENVTVGTGWVNSKVIDTSTPEGNVLGSPPPSTQTPVKWRTLAAVVVYVVPTPSDDAAWPALPRGAPLTPRDHARARRTRRERRSADGHVRQLAALETGRVLASRLVGRGARHDDHADTHECERRRHDRSCLVNPSPYRDTPSPLSGRPRVDNALPPRGAAPKLR